MMSAFDKAAMTHSGIGKLVPGALFNDLGAARQQPQVIERAKALERLEPQVIRITFYRLGQDGLHVPGIGDDDVIGVERPHGLAVACLDRVKAPT